MSTPKSATEAGEVAARLLQRAVSGEAADGQRQLELSAKKISCRQPALVSTRRRRGERQC